MGEVARKRSVRDGTVDKADFFEVLRDRQWHPLQEILYALRNKVPPEIASQYFINRKKRRIDDEAPETNATHAEKVAKGRRFFIRKRLNDTCDHGIIERKKTGTGDDDFSYRWSQWFCWTCGERFNNTPETGNHLCQECSKYVITSSSSAAEDVMTMVQNLINENQALRLERDAAVAKHRGIQFNEE